MFRLRFGYLLSGIATGLVLLLSFFWTLPDGKLHIVFCDVGQGDAAYLRFPDGRDMLVDGGPNDRVLGCLGRHMPFWDRQINLIVLTHPQSDHLNGLISVLERFRIDYFVRSDVINTTEGFQKLEELVSSKKIPVKFVTQGEIVTLSSTRLTVLWPSQDQIALMNGRQYNNVTMKQLSGEVLGAKAPTNLNDGSVVILLRYGSFDALFPGDADSRVEGGWFDHAVLRLADARSGQALNVLEVLKVPHHGSRTSMAEEFIQWLHPRLAVISVGKNNYGHPSQEILEKLAVIGSQVLRTDQEGDIEVISDGKGWEVKVRQKRESQ